MSEKKEEKEQPEVTPAEQRKLREVLIQTDGAKVVLAKCEVSPLELKSICRDLLNTLE